MQRDEHVEQAPEHHSAATPRGRATVAKVRRLAMALQFWNSGILQIHCAVPIAAAITDSGVHADSGATT